MSSREAERGERGTNREAARSSSPSSSDGVKETGENMKRAAAKQLIERYYYQLTDGCGNADCSNKFCASCQSFLHQNLSKNAAAAQALELFKQKALLCDSDAPPKVSKNSGEAASGSLRLSPVEPSTSGVSASSSAEANEKLKPGKSEEPTTVLTLSEEKLHKIIGECKTADNWSPLIRLIGQTYNNPDSLMRSFLKKPDDKSKEDLRAMEVDLDKDTDEKESKAIDDEAGEPSSSLPARKVKLKEDEVTVDIESLRRAYKELFAIPKEPFQVALVNAIISLSRDTSVGLKYHNAYHSNEDFLNIFIIVLEIPSLHSPEFIESATPQFCKVTGLLPVAAQAKLARVWARHSKDFLKSMVESLQQLITVKVVSTTSWNRSHTVNDDDAITGAARVMKLLFYASILAGEMDPPHVIQEERIMSEEAEGNLQELLQGAVGHEPKEKSQPKEDSLAKELGISPLDCRQPVVPWDDFVNAYLSENIEMPQDYTYYKAENEKFSFMTHSFLLTPATKNLGMYYDNRIRMINERRASLFQSLVHGAPTTPYLKLHIRRDHIISDALVALEMAAMDNPLDLKKQLYVEFEGEQGVDEGGVSKEFFQLVVEEIFNPDIGMFTLNEETQKFWFNPTSFENDGQFTLIGIMLGLAIYNNIILDVHFPMVVYRKLMGKKGTFKDLVDSHPSLARGLQELLIFEGNVEEVFMQNFHVSYHDVFGATLTHDLRENGSQIPVTNDNRQEFVDLYADFLLNLCIEKQFKAFLRGFHMVTDESPLKMLFRPDEVELLVCGSTHFDFHALEETTEYDGGFHEDSPTVKHFWEVVHSLSEDQQRKLLQFATGSDRVPIGGLAKIKLIIARNGPDSDRLPTSHTCFNVLLLPDYSSKEKLRERLMKAITYSKGFGML